MDDQIKAIQKEPAASKACPECGKSINYYWFSGMADLIPHFYCGNCPNVYYDEQHKALMYENEATIDLLDRMTEDLPTCDCGGRFQPGQSPKCPHCNHELLKSKNPLSSLKYPYVILIEGSKLFVRN